MLNVKNQMVSKGGSMKKFSLFLILMLVPAVCFAVSGYPQKPTVLNQTLTSSGTEYQVTFPAGTSGYSLQSRTAADFQYGTTSNTSGTVYYTIKSGAVYNTPTSLNLGPTTPNTTLFLRSGTAGQIVEIVYYQ